MSGAYMESSMARVEVPAIEGLNLKALNQLKTDVDAAIAAQSREEQKSLRTKLKKMARESGLDVKLVFGGRKPVRHAKATNGHAKPAKPAKAATIAYRNPKDPEQTWSGRGRQPRWVTAALKGGAKREELRA